MKFRILFFRKDESKPFQTCIAHGTDAKVAMGYIKDLFKITDIRLDAVEVKD